MYKQIISNNNKHNKVVSHSKKSTKGVSLEDSVKMRVCYQLAGLRGKELLKTFSRYHKATVFKHCRKPISTVKTPEDRKKLKIGKAQKLDERDKILIKQTILNLRATVVSFTSRRVQLEAGLQHASNRTVQRYMNELGYQYYRSRKNGLMTENDKKFRVTFCRKIYRHKLGLKFWKSGINFYFGRTGFVYKKNPFDQALAAGAREWRMRSEGLTVGCTAKEKKGRKPASPLHGGHSLWGGYKGCNNVHTLPRTN